MAAVDERDDAREVDVGRVGDRAAQRDLRRGDPVGQRAHQVAGLVVDLLVGGARRQRVRDVGGEAPWTWTGQRQCVKTPAAIADSRERPASSL